MSTLLARWRSAIAALRMTHGARSRARLLAFKLDPRRSARVGSEPVALRIAPLGGRILHLRPHGTDLATLVHVFAEGQHLPPIELPAEARICELGANVGTAVAALAHNYPAAHLLAVEPDPENAAIAARNLAQFGERCRLVRVAIWDHVCELVLEGSTPTSLRARPAEAGDRGSARVAATTIDELLGAELPDGPVDYLHLCIEGSEPRVLAAGGRWPQRVRSIRVELYPELGYRGEDCTAQLRALGFEARIESAWWGGYGIGVRG